jgi:glycosyltransferase involved in cell wall biosynthesis
MPDNRHELRVAIVHYWFLARTGGERVVEALAEMFPDADLFSLVADPRVLTGELSRHRLTTSFIQRLPGARKWYRHLLPIYPHALEQFDLGSYDLVISSESGPAKGVVTSPHTCHICYCHSPMRYVWDMYHIYRTSMNPLTRFMFSLAAHHTRLWDVSTASGVDYFVASSRHVARRIWKYYRRQGRVIYPPVNVSAGYLSSKAEDYYLVVSRLVPYKRIELAIETCNRLERRLRVVGSGPEYNRLRKLAGPTIEFLGWLDEHSMRENYAQCRALLFPGEEDFGLVPVEAQSFGRPVIAYAAGGALETVKGMGSAGSAMPEESTGVFFPEQTLDSLMHAVLAFERTEQRFSPAFIRAHSERFGTNRFKSEMGSFVAAVLADHRRSMARPSLPADGDADLDLLPHAGGGSGEANHTSSGSRFTSGCGET